MKFRKNILNVLLAIILATLSFTVTIEKYTKDYINRDSINYKAKEYEQEKYILRIHNGKIAAFKKDCETPFEIFDAPVINLPKEDLKALEKGIEADDYSILQKIAEDYIS